MADSSTMQMELRTKAPQFTLPDTDENNVSINEVVGANGLLVAFICNHCPYVKHVRHEFAALSREYMAKGIGVVAISSNDANEYPDDGPEMMAKEKAEIGYDFPYLYDETQEIAKAYGAACTPDFFLFDSEMKLVYRGQMDDTRPNGIGKPTGADLRANLDNLLEGKSPLENQKPSVGCGIKWKAGNAPPYAS